MPFKQFLRNLFERVGLAEPTAPPPQAADIPLADPEKLAPIFERLTIWGVKHIHLVADGESEAGELIEASRHAAQMGLQVGVRGLASHLLAAKCFADLASAGVREIEIPFLSAIGEVHDALAGAGDYRSALGVMSALEKLKLSMAVEIVVVPSTWKTIERTLQFLDDRGLREVRLFAVACRDEEPSSWAISAGELLAAAKRTEEKNPSHFNFTWYPPLKFDPSRTLAQQVRRGPRAAAHAVRIEADGQVYPAIGPAVAGGNLLQEDWKSIARSEVFRALKRRRDAAGRCAACPGVAVCERGCLRDNNNWCEG